MTSLNTFDLQLAPGELGQQQDLNRVDGRKNLAQAIVNRFYTRRGELTKLGHPSYGSRLYLLMGEPNNIRTRKLAEIKEIRFEPPSRDLDKRNVLLTTIILQPVGESTALNIQLAINL